MTLALNTPSCHDNYFCQIILASSQAGKIYGPDKNMLYYSLCKKLRVLYDLDLQACNIVLTGDTSSFHDNKERSNLIFL